MTGDERERWRERKWKLKGEWKGNRRKRGVLNTDQLLQKQSDYMERERVTYKSELRREYEGCLVL